MLTRVQQAAAINRLQPVAPSGLITPYDADLILQQGNSIPVMRPAEPVTVLTPVEPNRAVISDNVQMPVLPGQSVTVTTGQGTANTTGAGLLAWAKANPIPAIAIAGAAVYLIYTLTKRK